MARRGSWRWHGDVNLVPTNTSRPIVFCTKPRSLLAESRSSVFKGTLPHFVFCTKPRSLLAECRSRVFKGTLPHFVFCTKPRSLLAECRSSVFKGTLPHFVHHVLEGLHVEIQRLEILVRVLLDRRARGVERLLLGGVAQRVLQLAERRQHPRPVPPEFAVLFTQTELNREPVQLKYRIDGKKYYLQ